MSDFSYPFRDLDRERAAMEPDPFPPVEKMMEKEEESAKALDAVLAALRTLSAQERERVLRAACAFYGLNLHFQSKPATR